MAWLQHWVLDDATVELGPVVEVLDQHGATYAFDDYPVPTDAELSATGAGSLSLIADGGSGPAVPPPDSPEMTTPEIPSCSACSITHRVPATQSSSPAGKGYWAR